MRLPLYKIDAFADRVFAGNPAAVVLLEDWLSDDVLLAIAAENAASETTFMLADGDDVRWFAPKTEIPLCGHGTLAAAFVVMERLRPGCDAVTFRSRHAGPLNVVRRGDLYELDLPARPPTPVTPPPGLFDALGGPTPRELLAADRYLAVYDDPEAIRSLAPDMDRLARLDRPVCVTAPGDEGADFVSRYFAPSRGVPEDPVTGAAHCVLTPYWAARTGRTSFVARQESRRGGVLRCELAGDRVRMGGRAALYLEGTIDLASILKTGG